MKRHNRRVIDEPHQGWCLPPKRVIPMVKCLTCEATTKDGKPYCQDHIMNMAYAQAVQDKYIDPYMGARPLREITPPDELWLLPIYKELE